MVSVHNQLINSYLWNVNNVVALTEHYFRAELIGKCYTLAYFFLIMNLESNLILLQVKGHLHPEPMGFHRSSLIDRQGYQHTLPLLIQTEQDIITTKIKKKIENLSFILPLNTQDITDALGRIQSYIELQVKIVSERRITMSEHIIGCSLIDRTDRATKS